MQLHGLPTKNDTYVPTGKLWPSGDFSVGSRKVAGDSRVSLDTHEHWWQSGAMDALKLPYVVAGPYGIPQFSQEYMDTMSKYPGFLADLARPLDLTDAPNSHKPSNRPESYGRLGMTGYGKKMVRSACVILERRYKGRLTFATVTMPTLPQEMRKALAECWPEFLRQALQWLSRRLQSQRLPTAVCSVTEVQPGRLKAGNGGYLHLHMVWPNRVMRKGHHSVDVAEFRAWCESFLIRRGLWVEGAWVNVDTQPVEKSAAAYLSKYMSKGGDVLDQFVAENGWSACPGQWWNMTKVLRDRVKAELLTGDVVGEVLQMAVDYAFQCDDFSHFWSLRHVDMEVDGRFVTVGWSGILKAEMQAHFVKLCKATQCSTVDKVA